MLILMAAPEWARPFIEQLAKAISPDAEQVELRFDLDRPSHFELWPDVDILVLFALPCDARDMDLAPSLRAIIVPSLGYETIDIQAASARNITVANGHVAQNFESVAEAAFLFILMSLYDVDAVRERLRTGRGRSGPPTTRMLKGKTIGIIGYGNIARALIDRLTRWEVRILVYNRSLLSPSADISQLSLGDLLAESDVVIPLVPLTQETRHILSKARLLSMKAGACLINLSRGAIIEEEALSDPAVVEHLGQIALDVFETEPLDTNHILRNRKKTILTGHEISHTQESLAALLNMATLNVNSAILGQPLLTAVN